MRRKTAADFPPEVMTLFDGYVHGRMSRRDFLDRAGRYAVGGAAMAMLESLRPNYALAQQVAKDDPRLRTQLVTYPSPKGSGNMRGYVARPTGAAKLPGVIVIHENRGLNPYIEDVARRLATTTSRSRPTRWRRSAATPATTKKRRSSSPFSTPRSAPRTSSRRTTS